MAELNQLLDHHAFLVHSDRKCFYKQIRNVVNQPQELVQSQFNQTPCKKSQGKENTNSCFGIRQSAKSRVPQNIKKSPVEKTISRENQIPKEEDVGNNYNAKPLESPPIQSEEELEAEIIAAVSIACAYRYIDAGFWPFLEKEIKVAAYKRNMSDLQIFDLLYNKNVIQQIVSNMMRLHRFKDYNDVARINVYNNEIAGRISYKPWYSPFLCKTISIKSINDFSEVQLKPPSYTWYLADFTIAIGWTLMGIMAAFAAIRALKH